MDNSGTAPSVFPTVVAVSEIEVDPALLAATGSRLRQAVEVAEQVAARRGELAALADDAGHGGLTEAVHEFLGRWAHGLGCLVEDADALATMLTDAGSGYVELETSIAAAAGPGPAR